MARIRHLERAPITEALVDIRVERVETVDAAEFDRLKKALFEQYPRAEERQKLEYSSSVQLKTGETKLSIKRDFRGMFFRTEDGRQVAQFGVDGFTLNRLPPYGSWEELLGEAKRLWPFYCEACKPIRVVRLAVRYINHLELPQPGFDLSRVITTPPPVPPGLSVEVDGFLTKVMIKDAALDCEAVITQALREGVSATNAPAMLLDIDVFKEVQFEPEDIRIWSVLESFRDFKNRIFFQIVTEEMARQYE